MQRRFSEIQSIVEGAVETVATLRLEVSSLSSDHHDLRSRVEISEQTVRDSVEAITSLRNQHLDEINSLKQTCAQLSSVIGSSTSLTAPSSASSSSSDSAEIIIRGVPADLPLSEVEIVQSILTSLGIPHLMNHVIDTRVMKSKSKPTNSSSTPVSFAATNQSKKSLVCRMTSTLTRDFVLEKAFAKKVLSVRDAFSLNIDDRIYLHELLPANIHKLLISAKSRARELKLSRVWASRGIVRVRRDGCPDAIALYSESDLDLLV